MDNSILALIVGVIGIAVTLVVVVLEHTPMLKQRWVLIGLGILAVLLFALAVWITSGNKWYWNLAITIVTAACIIWVIRNVKPSDNFGDLTKKLGPKTVNILYRCKDQLRTLRNHSRFWLAPYRQIPIAFLSPDSSADVGHQD